MFSTAALTSPGELLDDEDEVTAFSAVARVDLEEELFEVDNEDDSAS